MRSPTRLACLAFVAFGALVADRSAFGQGRTIYAAVQVADNALASHPVMVSFIRDGEILHQGEEFLTTSPNAISVGSPELPAGLYDVRVEGGGIVTEVKRGVRLTANQNLTVKFLVRPGEGAHVVEYAEGGLAREEVAARLAALEAEVARLRDAP